MKKILLFGSFGQSNIGDEEILRIFVNFFKKNDCHLYINSSTPQKTSEEFNVESFSTSLSKDIGKKLYSFINTEAYVFGGGSLLLEYRKVDMKFLQTMYRALLLTLGIVIIGKILRKKIIFASIGIGPLKTIFGRILASIILSFSDLVIVRDNGSFHFAKEKAKNLVLSSDVVLSYPLLKTKPLRQIVFFPNYHLPLNTTEKELLSQEIVASLNALHDQGYKIFAIPLWYDFGEKNDLWYARFLQEKDEQLEILNLKEYSEISQYLSKSTFCITMKLHGAIFAALNQVPFVALNHHVKMEEFVKEINEKFLIDLKDFSVKNFLVKEQSLKFEAEDLKSLQAVRARTEKTFGALKSFLDL